jgi:hypothetical protein
MPNGVLGAGKDSTHIDADNLIPLLSRYLVGRLVCSGNAGVIDNGIELAESSSHLAEDAFDLVLVRDVQVPEAAGATRRDNAYCDRLAIVIEYVRDRYRRSLSGHHFTCGSADP